MKGIAGIITTFLIGIGGNVLVVLTIVGIAVFVDEPTILQPVSFAIGAIGVMLAIPIHPRQTNKVRWAGWTVSMTAVLLAGIIQSADATSDALRYPEFAYSIGQETSVAPECGCRYKYLKVHSLDWPIGQGVFRMTPEVMGNYKVDEDTVFILYTRVDRPLFPAMYIADTKESLRLRGHYPDRLAGGWLKFGQTREATAWLFDWPDNLPVNTEVLIQREGPIIAP